MEQIRLAKKEDATYISLLGRITFTESFGNLFRSDEELKAYLKMTFSVEKIERSLDKPNNAYWIAFADRLPVGYAKLKLKSPSTFIESQNISQLQKIYVLKDFLSMKIGKRLQELLIHEAKRNQSESIWLSVYKHNKRAIKFYERNEFVSIGEHEFAIGSQTFNFLAMSRQLAKD